MPQGSVLSITIQWLIWSIRLPTFNKIPITTKCNKILNNYKLTDNSQLWCQCQCLCLCQTLRKISTISSNNRWCQPNNSNRCSNISKIYSISNKICKQHICKTNSLCSSSSNMLTLSSMDILNSKNLKLQLMELLAMAMLSVQTLVRTWTSTLIRCQLCTLMVTLPSRCKWCSSNSSNNQRTV